jgi:hypothetical protein
MISNEDKEILRGGIQFLYRHIRFDDHALSRMSGNDVFGLFDERRYHAGLRGKVDPVFLDSVYETSEVHIATFILSILKEGLFSVKTLVVAIIYLSRFKEVTKVLVHTYSWRLLFLVALLVADKASEDKPIRNIAMVDLFPVINNAALNELELLFCLKIRFTLIVKTELYNSFVRDKLLTERISRDMSEATNFFLGIPTKAEIPAVTATPQTIVKRGNKIHENHTMSRSRSKQPDRFRANLMESSDISSQNRVSPRNVSGTASFSRALSESSFIGDSPRMHARILQTQPVSSERIQNGPNPIRGFAVPRLCREPRDFSYMKSPQLDKRHCENTPRRYSQTPPRWNMY